MPNDPVTNIVKSLTPVTFHYLTIFGRISVCLEQNNTYAHRKIFIAYIHTYVQPHHF